MKWNIENTGFNSGVFNMNYDETLAQSLVKHNGNPTIRIYGWKPFAISLGWNQSFDEIDLDKAKADGIDVVKRATGGRAILHAQELTYSVVMPVKEKNIMTVYDEISRALICGLNILGVNASIEKSSPNFPLLYKTPSSAACFSSAGRYEIKFNGKKLVGSAQRRYACNNGEEIVLQHGSILIKDKHKEIVNYLKSLTNEQRNILSLELEEKTTELFAILNRNITFDEAAEAIISGFKKCWNIV